MRDMTRKWFYMTHDSFEKLSGCLFPCTVYKYTAQKYTSSFSYATMGSNHNVSTISLSIAKLGMTIIKETYLYDEFTLIAEIGGSLGLFLGLSCVSLFDLIEKYRATSFTKKDRKQSSSSKIAFEKN